MPPEDHRAAEQPHRPQTGPWLLKIFGTWGTGLRSRNDFDIAIINLAQPPEDDPSPMTDADVMTTFLAEDVEPRPGLDVELGNQILGPELNGSWGVRDV